MKSLILALAGTVALGMSAAALAEETPRPADPTAAKMISQSEIKGEVLKVDGDMFVVKDDRSKQEVRFTVEKDVKAGLERPLKQGDRIEASLTPAGYAKTIRFETAKDQGKSPEGSNPTLSPDGKGSASGG